MDFAAKWNAIDPDDVLGTIPMHLNNAASGKDVAWNLSGCLDAASSRFKKSCVHISADMRRELTLNIVRSEIAAHACFPSHYAQEIHSGMQALVRMLELTSEEGRAAEPAYEYEEADTVDRVRILQNVCHHLALKENIAMRAEQHRASTMKKLKKRSGEGA